MEGDFHLLKMPSHYFNALVQNHFFGKWQHFQFLLLEFCWLYSVNVKSHFAFLISVNLVFIPECPTEELSRIGRSSCGECMAKCMDLFLRLIPTLSTLCTWVFLLTLQSSEIDDCFSAMFVLTDIFIPPVYAKNKTRKIDNSARTSFQLSFVLHKFDVSGCPPVVL